MAVLEKTTYGEHPEAETIISMVNLFGAMSNELRGVTGSKAFPRTESLLVSALITCAGAIHGEVLELAKDGINDCETEVDLTEEQMVTLLLGNFKVGIDAGRNKVQRIRDEFAAAGKKVN